MPLTYFQGHRTGDLMSRATNDLNAVRMMIGPAIMYSSNTVLVFIVAILLMLAIDVKLINNQATPFKGALTAANYRPGSKPETLPVSLAMIRMIRWFADETGVEIGYKPAGGIGSAKTALDYMALMKEELGTHWLQPHLFRFGASSLLTDIERQLEHNLTGHYAADYRMPMV